MGRQNSRREKSLFRIAAALKVARQALIARTAAELE
jgi:hypothetical protein